MADKPTEFEKTTRKMTNEYNENHKDSFIDTWLAIEKIREKIEALREKMEDRLPKWAVYYISFLCLLVGGLLGALVALLVALFK